MAARKPGRYLAPIALIAVIIAVVLVVRARLDHQHQAAARTTSHQQHVARDVKPQPSFYVVKAGDTLSGISVKTGVPIATLRALNPSADPSALQTGQRLRLRR